MGVGWREIDLAMQPKAHHVKVQIAQRLRAQTSMAHECNVNRLCMGSGSNVSNLVIAFKSEL